MPLMVRDTFKPGELYAAPYSLDPIPSNIRSGLIVAGILATLSVISCAVLLAWITWRMLAWQRHYRSYVGYNQYVLLIYQLLLADMQQSIAFVFSFHWVGLNKIIGPTSQCFAQAWFLHIGDVCSGFFVLAIAVHTWISLVRGYRIPFRTFLAAIIGIWVLGAVLTIVGPITHGTHFFLRAGSWCWISSKHETSRLTLHYLWIFIDEFGTILVYAFIFLHLRKQLSSIILLKGAGGTNKVVSQASRYMVVYPTAYVILTLPLAAGRMAAMSGNTFSEDYYLVAGCLITSCGWVDCLLYTLTRRVLVSNELGDTKSNRRGTDDLTTGWEIQSMDPETSKARNITTITGGKRTHDSFKPNRPADRSRLAHNAEPAQGRRRSSSPSLREPSPVGSTESIINREMRQAAFANIKTETRVEITFEHADSESSTKDGARKESTNSFEEDGQRRPWGRQ